MALNWNVIRQQGGFYLKIDIYVSFFGIEDALI